MLTVDELRILLKINNITTEFTDEELEYLINQKIIELQGLLGFDITPTTHTEIIRHYHDNKLILNYYNLTTIQELTLNNINISDMVQVIDNELSIIYFIKNMHGLLKITYITCLPENKIITYINPLLGDMIMYTLQDNWGKDATTIKEGDVSVSYDANLSLGNRILTRIQDLKNAYNARVRLI